LPCAWALRSKRTWLAAVCTITTNPEHTSAASYKYADDDDGSWMFMSQLKSASIRRLMAEKAQNVNFYKRHQTLIEEAYACNNSVSSVYDGV